MSWRRDFDTARDPYTARNALGITSTGGGSGFITAVTPPLQVTGTTLSIDLSAYSTTAAIAGAYQPLDADLTSLAAASATNAIYYRSAANTWATVTVGTGLTFSGGTLAAAAAGGITNIVIQKFTASGTYTPTTGMKFCIVEAIGGGGGGGGVAGAAGQFFVGSGGGSGGYSRSRLTAAQIGSSQPVTVGAGGTGSSNADGAAGSDTSLGSLVIAKGGGGGARSNASTFGPGGAGGVAGTGDVVATGDNGDAGLCNTNTGAPVFLCTGNGGSSFFGGGARGVNSLAAGGYTGNNASNYGGGGSGAAANSTAANAAGGNGSAGIIVITEYI